jgi:hypothetical protein
MRTGPGTGRVGVTDRDRGAASRVRGSMSRCTRPARLGERLPVATRRRDDSEMTGYSAPVPSHWQVGVSDPTGPALVQVALTHHRASAPAGAVTAHRATYRLIPLLRLAVIGLGY